MKEISNDILLFQRIKRDDRQALNTLFTNYYQKLCRFACTFSLSHQQAEEVVADVFFRLWEKREHLEIYLNFNAYLYKAVKREAIAILKKGQHEVELSDEHDLVDPITPNLTLEYQELQQHLDSVINRLPQRCRQIFILNRFDGMKYKEIGITLGVSEKTVENQLVKALDIVRLAVKKYQVVRDSREVRHIKITHS